MRPIYFALVIFYLVSAYAMLVIGRAGKEVS